MTKVNTQMAERKNDVFCVAFSPTTLSYAEMVEISQLDQVQAAWGKKPGQILAMLLTCPSAKFVFDGWRPSGVTELFLVAPEFDEEIDVPVYKIARRGHDVLHLID